MAAHLNIVVVEDHDALRELIVEALAGQGHHVVGLVCAEALDDEVGRACIDLLVTDLNLPGEDGLSLARRFRRAQPEAGIIMLTARIRPDDKIDGYESGADIYLPKPVEIKELIAAINALSRRIASRGAGNAANPSPMLRLETRAMILNGPAGKTDLTHDEAAILMALARAAGQRLEVWQLLNVLGMETDAGVKSILEVRIARLRKKLIGVGADKLCLRALRGHGYQLCVSLQAY